MKITYINCFAREYHYYVDVEYEGEIYDVHYSIKKCAGSKSLNEFTVLTKKTKDGCTLGFEVSDKMIENVKNKIKKKHGIPTNFKEVMEKI